MEALTKGFDEYILAIDPGQYSTQLGFPPDNWQSQLLGSSHKRKVLNCSRQSGKSQIAAIKASHTAWVEERRDMLIISPTLRQSVELQAKIKDVIRNARHDAEITYDLDEDSKMSCALSNGSRIISLPGQNPGNIRGYSRPRMIIIDEAAYATDELYEAVRPMLARAPDCELIVMSTPHGKRGFFYSLCTGTSDRWERYVVAATSCPHISEEFLLEEQEELGPLMYAQEYCNQFIDTEEQLFSTEHIEAAFTSTREVLNKNLDSDRGLLNV